VVKENIIRNNTMKPMYKKGGKSPKKMRESWMEESKEVHFGNKPKKMKTAGFPDLNKDGKNQKILLRLLLLLSEERSTVSLSSKLWLLLESLRNKLEVLKKRQIELAEFKPVLKK